MQQLINEEEIDNLLAGIDEIHLYDPELISMTEEEYQELLDRQFEDWEEYLANEVSENESEVSTETSCLGKNATEC